MIARRTQTTKQRKENPMNTDELSTGGGAPSAKSKKREGEKRTSPLTPLREKGKGKEQDRVSCETSCSKTARAHVRRKLPCACSFSEAGAAAALPCGDRRCPLRGSVFSPVRGFDLPCTGVSLPLYGQDNFPFMGVEGKQTNENRKEKQDEGKVHNGEGRQQGPL